MTSQVWKYPLQQDASGAYAIDMPDGAMVLTLQLQDELPTMWAAVNPDNPKRKRRFIVAGTGWSLPNEPMDYIGTWQLDAMVWHVFELTGYVTPSDWKPKHAG